MGKQRLVKMTGGDQNILVKALRSTQDEAGLEQFNEMQVLIDKAVNAPKRKLYLNDEELEQITQSLNSMRNSYLLTDRSSGGIDRLLVKVIQSKYKQVPVR